MSTLHVPHETEPSVNHAQAAAAESSPVRSRVSLSRFASWDTRHEDGNRVLSIISERVPLPPVNLLADASTDVTPLPTLLIVVLSIVSGMLKLNALVLMLRRSSY
jgi:hypothetical protein